MPDKWQGYVCWTPSERRESGYIPLSFIKQIRAIKTLLSSLRNDKQISKEITCLNCLQNDKQIRTTINLLNCLSNHKEIRGAISLPTRFYELHPSLYIFSHGKAFEARANIEKTKKAKTLRLSYNLNNIIISHRRPRHDTRAGKRKTRGR